MNISWKFIAISFLAVISSSVVTFILFQEPYEIYQVTLIEPNYSGIESGGEDDKWMFFMTFLSTIFAIFFVYAGFKIDMTREKVDEAERRICEWEKKGNDLVEFSIQLQYAMSYNMEKSYDKAIDVLASLRNEPFVRKDSNKINTCNYFLAHCYYEMGIKNGNKDDLAMAVQYIDQAIEDEGHPFRNEIINEFNKLDKK